MKRILHFIRVTSILFVAIGFWSCGESKEPVTAVPEAIVEETELDAVEIPEVDNALITFLTGDVSIQVNDEWVWANIGDYLEKDGILKVEDGYAELQFGDVGTARIQENTTIRLANIILQPGATQVDINLVTGNVLNKVQHLAMEDSYQVRTQTAVMGVRGTEFGVRVDENQDTRVAVRDGRVGVLPSTVDVQRMQEKAGTSARAGQAVQAAIAAIQDISPVVEANQEIVMDQATVQTTAEAVRLVEEKIEEIAREPERVEDSTEDTAVTDFIAAAQETVRKASETAVEPARTISEESRQELQKIDEIRVIQLPPRVPETETAAESAETVPQPALVPIVIEVEPADSQISMGGRVLGSGRFQGIFVQGEVLDFVISKDGFVSKDLHVEMKEARGRSISVKLAAVPRPEPVLNRVEISVEPVDARIFIDGREAGTRRVREEIEVGRTITIRAELEGYSREERTFTVLAGRNANSIELFLRQIMVEVAVASSPVDAKIFVNGEESGTGSYSGTYPPGTTLDLEAQLEGYEQAQQRIVVSEGMAPVSLELAQMIRELQITADPAQARIFLDNEAVGTGSYRNDYPVGTELALNVTMDGYRAAEQTVTVTEANEPVAVSLERLMGTLSIRVEPADAEIFVDGRRAGSGSLEQSFPAGTQLQVEFRKSGFAPLAFPVTIQEGDNTLEYQLSQDIGTVQITVSPRSAEVVINGVLAGTGSLSRDYPVGQELMIEVRSDNFDSQSRQMTIQKGANRLEVTLRQQQTSLRLGVVPDDAEITINGARAGQGSVTRSFPRGDRLQVVVRRPGYAEVSQQITASGTEVVRTIRLEPRPIEADFVAGRLPLVRSLAVQGDTIYSADTTGTVRAHSHDGRRLWEVTTANAGNENSMPVVSGDRVIFSGAAEMVFITPQGSIIQRRTISGEEAHLFGRRVIGWNGGFILPTDSRLIFLDRDGTDTGRSITMTGGSKMSPLVTANRVVIADQQGAVHLYNPESGAEIASIQTSMSQPVAHAPVEADGIAVLVGRRGTAAAIDINQGTTVWEETLRSGSGVFTDPLVYGGAAYFFSRNQIEARAIRDGALLFEPIAAVSCAPVNIGNSLYFGTNDGLLKVADGRTGRVTGTLNLPAKATAAAVSGERLVLGLENGHILVIHPDGIR